MATTPAKQTGTPVEEQDAPQVDPYADFLGEGRRESYTARRPDGSVVVVHRNIDTGASIVTPVEEGEADGRQEG